MKKEAETLRSNGIGMLPILRSDADPLQVTNRDVVSYLIPFFLLSIIRDGLLILKNYNLFS